MSASGGPLIQSLLKALHILSLFTREKPELRLKEICELLNFPPSTAHRLLRTLEEEDLITQNPDNGKYRLGAAVFIIGTNVIRINKLVEVSLPYIARLSTKYNATTHVAIEQNGHVLCLEKIEPMTNIVKTPPRGSRHELHLTSVGKSLLAFSPPKKQAELIKTIEYQRLMPHSIMNADDLMKELKLTKQRGYAVDALESAENLYCFGAPILDDDGYAIGAISVSLSASRFPDSASNIIRDVKGSASAISTCLHKSL